MRRRGDLDLAGGDPHVGPHLQSSRDRPRGGGQIDVGRDREVVVDERLGPLPGTVAGQADPPGCLGLKQRRRCLERADQQRAAVGRQIERQLAAVDRKDFGEALGITEGERPGGHRTGDLQRSASILAARVCGRCWRHDRKVEPDVCEAINQMAAVEAGRPDARDAERNPAAGDGDRAWSVGRGRLRRRDRPATVAGERRGGGGGDRGPIEPVRRRIGDRRGRPGDRRHQVADRLAGMHHTSRHRPARGNRGIADRGRGHEFRDPPSILTGKVDEFDRPIDEFEFAGQGDGRRLRPGRQPGGENVLQIAAAPPHLHQTLAADEPDRAKVARVDGERGQTPVADQPLDHDHGPTGAVEEHDIPILDAAKPAPRGRAARHPAVDPGQRRRQWPVAEFREHEDRRRNPGHRQEQGEERRREYGPAASRPSTSVVSGKTCLHDGGV